MKGAGWRQARRERWARKTAGGGSEGGRQGGGERRKRQVGEDEGSRERGIQVEGSDRHEESRRG